MKRPTSRSSRSASPYLAALALAGALLAPSAAHASAIFPSEVQAHLGLKSVPACTLCHQTLSGGTGTATRPFGVTARANGAVAGSVSALDGALDAMKSKNTDSDGDCVGDIAELIAGTDPDNGSDNPGACGDGGSSSGSDGGSSGAVTPPESTGPGDPQYGCAAGGASPRGPRGPGGQGSPLPFAVGAAAIAGAWLRRARRRRDP
jgi:hypothetical protein